jgi:cytochrome c-type biogenesis protein CcmE
VARKRSPARLVVALSVAAVLAVFLVYTAIAGGGTPTLEPSQPRGHSGVVNLGGRVVGPVRGDSYSAGGERFRIRDVNGTRTVTVVYHGQVPDLFKVGRHVIVTGRMTSGAFVAQKDSLVTKCPSKYTAKKTGA